jgi:hypothetical protein
MQYLLGLRALGHDVYYLEDCGRSSWVYVWETRDWTHELDYPAAYVRACLEPCGWAGRWIYRDNYRSVGMPLPAFLDVCRRADLLILRAAPFWNWREEYDAPRRRAFIDVDPGFTQIRIANGDAGLAEAIARAERRFTYGLRCGAPDCLIPTHGGPWHPTRPPVFLPEWPVAGGQGDGFTTVMRWQGQKEVTFDGITYGQRDQEFPAYLELPKRAGARFRLAQMGADPESLRRHGWDVLPGEEISKTPESYRRFIQGSRAEFGVPKQGYVKMRGGWFSDRSVCYLASGRPVVVEDTGLADTMPVGQGVLPFRNPDEAARMVRRVEENYESERRAARRLAEEIFTTELVLPPLLEAAMN